MSTTVFINAMELTDFAYKNLPMGTTAFDASLDIAAKLPDSDKIVILAGENFTLNGSFKIVHPSGPDMKDLVDVFREEAGDSENIFYFYGDTPLLDYSIT